MISRAAIIQIKKIHIKWTLFVIILPPAVIRESDAPISKYTIPNLLFRLFSFNKGTNPGGMKLYLNCYKPRRNRICISDRDRTRVGVSFLFFLATRVILHKTTLETAI